MSRNHNNFSASGLVGNTNLHTTSNGTEVLNFSVANVENKKVNEEWKNITHWINCSLWKPSEHDKKQIQKGVKVFVNGAFRSSEKDGTTYWNLKVNDVDYEYKKNFAEPSKDIEDDDAPF